MKSTEQATRPKRVRKRQNGRLLIAKRPDSAGNATPRRVFPVHAGASKVLRRGVLDRRGAIGKAFYAETAGLRAHMAGDLSLPEVRLIEQAARLHIIAAISWAEILAAPGLTRPDGTVQPAIDVFLRTQREQRSVLELLGVKRRAKPIQTLQEIMSTLPPNEPAIPATGAPSAQENPDAIT